MTFEEHDAAHRDAVPGRVRRGDGLQRQLRHVAAVRDGGDSSQYLKRYLVSAAIGLARAVLLRRATGWRRRERLTPILLVVAFAGLLLVLVPGFGIEANGARRWLGAGPLQIQPSELAKLALVLYAAVLIAAKPQRTRSLYGVRPLLAGGRRRWRPWSWSSPTSAPRS